MPMRDYYKCNMCDCFHLIAYKHQLSDCDLGDILTIPDTLDIIEGIQKSTSDD